MIDGLVLIMQSPQSTAMGAVLGAFVGDVLGAYLKDPVSPEEVDLAMTMPGGGPFGLGQGQGTGTSELAICQIRGLLEGNGKLDLDAVARYYGRWADSEPLNLGMTVGRALKPLGRGRATADVCISAAVRGNSGAQSHGSLARLAPLAVWAHRLSPAQAVRAAQIEGSMTHPDLTIQHANACYLLAITHLINHPGDNNGAFLAARDYAISEENQEIKEWFNFMSTGQVMPGTPQEGWAKIAFTHAFGHLRNQSGYVQAIRETLLLGGLTFPNAAIVGGLIGAAQGEEGIPAEYVEEVTGYTYASKLGYQRPDFLNQTEVREQVMELYTMAPTTATVVIGGVEQPL